MSTGLRWIWLILVILVLDINSKYLIMKHYSLGESISIVSFVNFTYVHNSGAAFGFFANKDGWQRWFLCIISVVISVSLLVIMYNLKHQERLFNMGYAMIIGGALGNLFDRIMYGVVIDFIDFYIGNWHYPNFNVADSSICIGTILIILKDFCRHSGD